MLRRCLLCWLLLLGQSDASQGAGEVLVIVNNHNSMAELNREQVVAYFMGREQNFPNSRSAFAIDLPPDSPVRANFYQQLVGKSVAQVNAYWARLLFTGAATPPKTLPNSATVLSAVRDNIDAIAYIDSQDFDGCCKVLFRLKSPEKP